MVRRDPVDLCDRLLRLLPERFYRFGRVSIRGTGDGIRHWQYCVTGRRYDLDTALTNRGFDITVHTSDKMSEDRQAPLWRNSLAGLSLFFREKRAAHVEAM